MVVIVRKNSDNQLIVSQKYKNKSNLAFILTGVEVEIFLECLVAQPDIYQVRRLKPIDYALIGDYTEVVVKVKSNLYNQLIKNH